MKIGRFVLLASALAVVLIIVSYFFIESMALPYHFGSVVVAILVAYFPTLLAYSLTYMGLDKNTSQFVGYLGTGMIGKMLIGVLSIILVHTKFRELRDPYVVTYIIAYFIFTAFEVFGLIRKLRPKF